MTPTDPTGTPDTDDLTPQQKREYGDPEEVTRPLPWFLTMFMGAMAMWGAFYIYATPGGGDSSLGDQRTVEALRPPVAATGAAAGADGKQLFAAKCAACHQATGLGVPGVFPPLAGSEWVAGEPQVLSRILLHGVTGELTVKGTAYKGAMPAFNTLTDDELAALMTFIRSEWGNQAPAVTANQVQAEREATKARTAPYAGGDAVKAGG
jgi:mono/diheme cytochrome c family protein